MPFKSLQEFKASIPLALWIGGIAVAWLLLISAVHLRLNFEKKAPNLVRMGYMPVISNLACPLLDYASREGNGVRLEAMKFSSFAELGEALREGHIEAAFMIAPLAVVLRQQGADVKVVYIGNRHESTLVVRKDLPITDIRGLANRKIAVPLRYSGHNLAVRRLAEKFRLRPGEIEILEMNPPDMPSALATGALDAYFVGEPFAAQSIRSGRARVLHYVEEIWPGFICNLLLVKQAYIQEHPDRVQKLVEGAVRSGLWAESHPQEAARIASLYWSHPPELIEYALTIPKKRIVFDRFVPREEEIQDLANQMRYFNLLEQNRISGLIENRFALTANLKTVPDIKSIVR